MKHTRNIIAVAIAAFFCCIPLFSAEIEMYRQIYRFTNTWQDKLNIINEVIGAFDSSDAEAADFYKEVLDDILLKSKQVTNVSDKKIWDTCAGIIANRMGLAKSVDVDTKIWSLYEIADDPAVKAGILESLADMQSATFFPRILSILHDINETPGPDAVASEKIAYGAISALGTYANEQAYKQVFIAWSGWYSKQTKDLALKTLPLLSQIPTTHLIDIINDASIAQAIKAEALNTAVRKETGLSGADKVAVSIAAYAQSQTLAPIDTKGKDLKRTMADISIRQLIAEQDHSPEAVPLLKESTRSIYGSKEQLIAIEALGVNGTDAATEVLAELLTELNTKRVDGNFGDNEELFVRSLIPALGATKNAKARAPLWAISQISSYTNTIKRMAAKALKLVPKAN